jgi:hypothetical protein
MRIVIALFLFCAPASWALCPFPEPQPCNMYFQSNAVFVGTVVSHHYVNAAEGDEGDNDGTEFTLSVSRWFKGGRSKTISVVTPNASSREPLDEGQTYLVFAFPGRDGLRHVIQCGDTFSGKEMPDAIAKTEAVIAANRKRVLPTITVIVGDRDGPTGNSLMEGVPVHVSGPDGLLSGKTDKNGEFKVQVSPGTYQVKLPRRKYESSFYGNGYEPERVPVTYGECAFVVIVTTR